MQSSDPNRTCYGLKEVMSANEQLAIDNLLIVDKLYRADDFELRNKYVELIDSVKHSGGKVYKFSSLHVSGEELNNYTGIAATLRFPLFEEHEHEGEAVK
jgi:protein pelota